MRVLALHPHSNWEPQPWYMADAAPAGVGKMRPTAALKIVSRRGFRPSGVVWIENLTLSPFSRRKNRRERRCFQYVNENGTTCRIGNSHALRTSRRRPAKSRACIEGSRLEESRTQGEEKHNHVWKSMLLVYRRKVRRNRHLQGIRNDDFQIIICMYIRCILPHQIEIPVFSI